MGICLISEDHLGSGLMKSMHSLCFPRERHGFGLQMPWANCPIAVPVCASTEVGQTTLGAPLNASKLQISRMHRGRDSANLSPWGNSPKGNGLRRMGVQVSAGDGWEAHGSPPLFSVHTCVPRKHMEECSRLYSWEPIP